MQIYKLKAFARFQRREAIADVMLSLATRRAEDGLVDADLGGGLVKQRVARRGQGKVVDIARSWPTDAALARYFFLVSQRASAPTLTTKS